MKRRKSAKTIEMEKAVAVAHAKSEAQRDAEQQAQRNADRDNIERFCRLVETTQVPRTAAVVGCAVNAGTATTLVTTVADLQNLAVSIRRSMTHLH